MNPNLAWAQSRTSCCKTGMKSGKWKVEKWKSQSLASISCSNVDIVASISGSFWLAWRFAKGFIARFHVPLFTAQKNTAVELFLWKKYRSAQEINNDGVSNGENGGAISTHLHKSTWSASPLRQRKPRWMRAVQLSIWGQWSCPSAMDQLPLLKVFKMVTPDAPWELKLTIRSASILALASRPKFLEVPHSRAPQQPVRDNRHHLRRIPAAKTGQWVCRRKLSNWCPMIPFLGGAENPPILCKARLGTGFSARTQKRPYTHGRIFLAGGRFEPELFSRPRSACICGCPKHQLYPLLSAYSSLWHLRISWTVIKI